MVHVRYGSPAGLSAASSQLWYQDGPGIDGRVEIGDSFGWDLTSDDFYGDGFADLAVRALFEDIGDVKDAGAVSVLYGSASGLSFADNQFWSQGSPGKEDRPEKGDFFGEF